MADNINLRTFISQAWEHPEEQTIASYVIKNKDAIEQNPFGAKDFFAKLKQGNAQLLMNCSPKFTQMLDQLSESVEDAKELRAFKIVRGLDENRLPCIKREKVQLMEFRVEWDTTDIIIHNKDHTEIPSKVAQRIVNLIKHDFKLTSPIRGRTDGQGTYSEITVSEFPIGLLIKFQTALKKINRLLVNDVKTQQKTTIPAMENKEVKGEQINENDTADMAVYDTPTAEVMKRRLELFDPYKNAINVAKDSKTTIKFKAEDLKESVSRLGDLNKIFVVEHTFISRNPTAEILVTSDLGRSLHEMDKKKFANFIKRNVDVKSFINEKGFNFNGFIKTLQEGELQLIIKEYFAAQLTENTGLEINDFNIDFDKVSIGYFYPQDENETRVEYPFSDFKSFCERIDPAYNDFFVNDRSGNEDYAHGFGMVHDFEEYWGHKSLQEQNEIAKRFLKAVGVIKEAKKLQKEGFRDYNIWKAEVATTSKNNFKIIEHKGKFIAKSDKTIIGGWNPEVSGGFIYK